MSILRILLMTLAVIGLLASVACTDDNKHPSDEDSQSKAEINAKALRTLIDAQIPMTIVDARGDESFQKAHIVGAVNLPPGASDEHIAKTLNDKEALIVTYCGSTSCPLSNRLATRLTDMGYTNVIEYPEGMQGWVKNLGPVEGSILDEYRTIEE